MSNILGQSMIKSGLLNTVSAPDDMTTLLQNELDDMVDMDLPFNSAELMSSEFFDSVLSMERENGLDSVLDSYDYDLNMSDGGTTGSHIDSGSALSPSTASSDCDDRDRFVPVQDDAQENNSITLFGSEITNEAIDTDLSAYFMEKQASLVSTYSAPPAHKNKVIVRRQNRIQTNYNNKKIIVTNPMNNNKTSLSKNQVIRVQSISGNGRSLLLPVNVKKIKIVNANSLKMENLKVVQNSVQQPIMRKVHIDKYASSSAESVDDDMDLDPIPRYTTNSVTGKNDRSYPPLELTSEERRLLYKEGIQLPTHYPLTKNEEKELKRIRRKIRNKISAQDSRKRKKEYVDKLEEQAKRTCEENEFLKKRIKLLRKQNTKLMDQMRRLQEILFRSSGTKATPTTCLMIVLFSTLLVCLPNMRSLDQTKQQLENNLDSAAAALNQNQLPLAAQTQTQAQAQTSSHRRALLFNQKGGGDVEGTDAAIVSSIREMLVLNRVETDENETKRVDGQRYTQKHGYMIGDEGEDQGVEEILANCFDSDGNMRHNISTVLSEFCKSHEDDILTLLKSMLLSQHDLDMDSESAGDLAQQNNLADKWGLESVVSQTVESFIEPDISDDEEQFGKGQYAPVEEQPPLKRMRVALHDGNNNNMQAQ